MAPRSLLSLLYFLAGLLLCVEIPLSFAGDENEYSDSSRKIHISGEGGLAFFDTGIDGEFPNKEFRVDEAKLFVEAEVWKDIYFFGEVNLLTREKEEAEDNIHLGELYVEFGGVSRLWENEHMLNIRLGRFDIPFGEEYLTRDAIDNPFVTHSLSDIWGVDEGVEVFGSWSRMEYVFAIQNGGDPELRDFNSDKAVVGKGGYKWNKHVHFSVSGMRTGKIEVEGDRFSELWFGNGFLRVLGSPTTTTNFQAKLFQGDANANWMRGHLHVGAGHFHYDDNDVSTENARNVNYFQIEGVQNLNYDKNNILYIGIRFSIMTSSLGFPLVGNGEMERFLFDNNLLTTRLWRLSFGIGYRIKKNVVLKTEYNLEHGRQVNGQKRDAENFFGAETAIKF